MFSFLRRNRDAGAAEASGPEGQIVFAIGDIHGCLDQLDLLLKRISDEIFSSGRPAHLIFLGDYVDRGPDSAAVLDRRVDGPLPGDRHPFLMGNHEEAMLASLEGDVETLTGWLRYGGLETLESYGIGREDVMRLGADLPRRMRDVIPAKHVAFLDKCENLVRSGDFLFVHAGIRPGIALAEQDPTDLRWIRNGFLDDDQTDHGMIVVHGHTVTAEPDMRRNRIGIDTGCFKSGRLTALVIDGTCRRFLCS